MSSRGHSESITDACDCCRRAWPLEGLSRADLVFPLLPPLSHADLIQQSRPIEDAVMRKTGCERTTSKSGGGAFEAGVEGSLIASRTVSRRAHPDSRGRST